MPQTQSSKKYGCFGLVDMGQLHPYRVQGSLLLARGCPYQMCASQCRKSHCFLLGHSGCMFTAALCQYIFAYTGLQMQHKVGSGHAPAQGCHISCVPIENSGTAGMRMYATSVHLCAGKRWPSTWHDLMVPCE